MSDVDKIVIGARRRLLSDDFNRGERLSSRALLETIGALSQGDLYKVAADGVGGVVGGLLVRALVGTNRIEVSPGIAIVAQAPASATYDPPVEWIELREAFELDLDSFVDGGNPRLITIEIEANSVTKVSEIVDIFDPVTGSFTAGAQDVVTGSEPIVSANAGAAAASPVVAAGSSGKIPLAIVKLTTGQVSFPDEFASILMCRPLLTAQGNRDVPRKHVRGGGVSVGEEDAGVIANLGVPFVHSIEANLDGLDATVGGIFSFTGNGRTPSGETPASLISANQPVYGYVAPPPWVADYGDIAPREAWHRNPNEVNYSNAESIIVGEGSTFASLASFDAPYQHFRNGIVFWTATAPNGIESSIIGNVFQVRDARGPHPDTDVGGSGSITLDPTNDPTWGTPQVISDSCYVGSLASLTATFMGQNYRGSGYVQIIDSVDFAYPASGQRPVHNLNANTGGLVAFYPGRFPDMLVGDDEVIPAGVSTIELHTAYATGTLGVTNVAIRSAFGFGGAAPATSGGSHLTQVDTGSTGAMLLHREHVRVSRLVDDGSTVQSCEITLLVATGTEHSMALCAYEDLILAAR